MSLVAIPAPTRSPIRRRLLWAAAVLGLLLIVLWLLLVSSQPLVAPVAAPTAQTVEAGRQTYRELRGTQGYRDGTTRVILDNRKLAGVAALGSDATGIRRVDARVEDGRFTAAASLRLPFRHWFNVAVAVSGTHQGFPALNIRAGHLDLPVWFGRSLAEMARWALYLRGSKLPQLDQMVAHVAVADQALIADLRLPRRSGLVRGVINLQAADVDGQDVARIYCRLVTLQRQSPDLTLVTQVRRAFSLPSVSSAESHNRAVFVALAMLTVGERAADLAPSALDGARACGMTVEHVVLGGRTDLAKHWALSAALGAMLGTDTAGAIGEWKELADSLPQGSGFSFVDLAADRSGLHVARRATDPQTAAQMTRSLANATEERLLPISLLAAQEGLTEAQFLERFRAIDAKEYQITVKWIDRELALVGTR